MLEIDEIGLEPLDRQLLETVILKFKGGPVGLDTIATSLSEEPETIEDVHEPYLIQIGFLARTASGRVATELAYRHLGIGPAGPRVRSKRAYFRQRRVMQDVGRLLLVFGVLLAVIGGGSDAVRPVPPAGRFHLPERERDRLRPDRDEHHPVDRADGGAEPDLPAAIDRRIKTGRNVDSPAVQLVLSWPVRLFVVAILVFSLFVDGAGYIYRIANHYPLTGNVPGLPPNFGGWQFYIHNGLDLSGGTHIDYQLTNFPPGQIARRRSAEDDPVINKRVNALGVSEPEIRGAGTNNDRITVDLAGVTAEQAQKTIGAVSKLVYTKWVPDAKVTGGPVTRLQARS